jgi:hypothetical protein
MTIDELYARARSEEFLRATYNARHLDELHRLDAAEAARRERTEPPMGSDSGVAGQRASLASRRGRTVGQSSARIEKYAESRSVPSTPGE